MRKLVFLFFMSFIVCWLQAQDRTAKFDSLFSQLHKENKFSGNVLIAENGKPIFQKNYGMAFREKGQALNSESVFELASVSKQFTAMAIMILKKQGKLSYEDSLRKFFPELPYHNISIRQLLNHTSGLPDYMELAEKYWDASKIMKNRDMIALLAEKKPAIHFLPGEKWEYCNTGYALLGSIVEKASGKTFAHFMADNIYRPLGMTRTQVYHKRLEKRTIDNYAYGYVMDDTKKDYVMADSSSEVKSIVYSLDGIFGDGITNSTTTDLLKWDQALYSEKLVSKTMMQEAFTPATLNNGKKTEYGFGWLIREHPVFNTIYFHSGGWPGYATWIERHPKTNKTIILLANAGSASKIVEIRNILYQREDQEPPEIKLDEKIMSAYVGDYKMSDRDSIHVMLENGKLFAYGAGQPKHQLHPERHDLFFRKNSSYKTKFVLNENGKVESLKILRETGPAIEAVKVEKRKTVLAIFPHPDDETAIAEVLIKYAELGYNVQLIIATDGKDGTRVTKIPAGDSLGALRKEETKCACKIMNIAEPIFLGIDRLDSRIGVGKFFGEYKKFLGKLKEQIVQINPDFIITFGPDGDTHHSEHTVCGGAVTELLLAEGWVEKYPLYYVAWTKAQAEQFDLGYVNDQYFNVKINYTQEQEDKALNIMPCYVTQFLPDELTEDRRKKLEDKSNTIHFRQLAVKKGVKQNF